jgi:amidase
MGRTVADVALLLSAMAGPDDSCPLSLSEPGEIFAAPLERDVRGLRVAWSEDAGGLPVEADVRAALAPTRAVLEELGCEVVDGFPDLSDAGEIFQVLRAVAFETGIGPLYDERRDDLKDTIRWNVELARGLTASEIGRATRLWAELRERVRRFFGEYDFLALPVSQLAPFPVEVEWPREVAGVSMHTYIDWMRSCSDITLTSCPAIAVPAGFTPAGLPVGLQLVGRFRDDLGVLRLAHAFEQATRVGERRPPILST